MRTRVNRTALAFALTLVAVAAPCTFWYFAGWRAAQQEAVSLSTEPERAAHATAQQLAEQLRERLTALIKAEDKRPYFHYQNLIHDPNGAYEGVSVHPSPLADGPSDPYILAYFQIDSASRVSLPTLNDEVEQTDKSQEDIEKQQAIRKQLEPTASLCLDAFRSMDGNLSMADQIKSDYFIPKSGSAPVPQISGGKQMIGNELKPGLDTSPASSGFIDGSSLARAATAVDKPSEMPLLKKATSLGQTRGQMRAVEMKPDAYAQNQFANEVFLNNSSKTVASKSAQPARQIPVAKSSVTIHIGPFQWLTIPVGGKPALAAVREVITPEGRLIQGFVITASSAQESLQGAAFPAAFMPIGVETLESATVAVADTGWQIAINTAPAIAQAKVKAAKVKRTFLSLFFGGMAAAAAAGFCVIGLVWQTERLARQRSQFAASAAHELRTPLTGLRMYGEMLAEGLGNPAKTADYARRIASEAERLGRVISNVLGFTRLERGQLTIHSQPGDMAAAVREAICRQQTALEMAGVQVELAIEENTADVSFDSDALAVILQNLLDNAEKHTRSAADRSIQIVLKSCDGAMVLSISDHGPGIPHNIRRRLFRPFVRGDQPDTPAGLGLGLAMAKALVHAHNGTLRYADTEGGGATFTAFFPL